VRVEGAKPPAFVASYHVAGGLAGARQQPLAIGAVPDYDRRRAHHADQIS
jgi:hypothetical protein